MASNSILSSNSFYLGLNLAAPPHSSSIISRRTFLIRPISFRAKQSLDETPLILTVDEMQSSTNISTTESIVQEDTKKISSGENTLTSTENTGLNFGQLSDLVNNIPIWGKFVLGSVFLLAIPLLRKSFRIKDVTKIVEEVAEAAEKAAEVTEKVAEEIAEALPDGAIKEAAIKLEKIASLADKEAQFTETIVDKVDDAVEAVDKNLKLIAEKENKKNDEEEKTLKKIVVEQSKEAQQ